MSSTYKRARADAKIPVVVVESHQHILEHIHYALRRRKTLTEPIYMLHFDAHSDLACAMDVPARLCFQPRTVLSEGDRNLYELLDLSTTGIAEWILPLVLAANLRHVDWIRPASMFEQFPSGEHSFHVGVWIPKEDATSKSVETFDDLPDSARLRVDFDTPYYRNDAGGDSYVATEELVLKQTLNLRVADPNTRFSPRASDAWILDICLDYFCSLNPFISDLTDMSNDVAKALDDTFRLSTVRSSPNSVSPFQTALSELLGGYLEGAWPWQSTPAYLETCRFFSSASDAQALLMKLESALIAYQGDKPKLVAAAVDAIPYWTMPHSNEVPSNEELKKAIDNMTQQIRQQRSPPLFISISRSAADGFTPIGLVEDLQHQVLEAVHSLYPCSCTRSPFVPSEATSCSFEIVYDYGKWEGSTLNL